MYVVISGAAPGLATLTSLDENGIADPDEPPQFLEGDDLVEAVEALELENPRWVWSDTSSRYGWLLAHGVRVDRCHDLRLTRAILRASALTAGSALAASPRGEWDGAAPLLGGGYSAEAEAEATASGAVALDFDATTSASAPAGSTAVSTSSSSASSSSSPDPSAEQALAARTVAELALQLDAIRTSAEPNRLRLLIAAESAGALVAAEMSHAGLPWREDLHDELLTELLGPRVAAGQRPERLEALVGAVRRALDAPRLNPDSPQDLLRALQGAGLGVTTTRSWELKGIDHPVVAPLLEYKKLVRLLTANGWSWMESWVTDGRFFPDYVPGGVVSGRWATRGGGALQLPKQVRRAVTADDGWTLVVADAAQLEPRILAGISADTVMAEAGRGTDLYAGIVSSGAVQTRAQAKVAMLGAMYGATSGESGRLLPRLARAFPTALAYVENAARAGERGEVVTSRLGRSAPRPGEQWFETQALAREGAPDERVQQQARREARDWGRFTRNFVVQASAADWALCWMADLRRRLAALAPAPLDDLDDLDLDGLPLEHAADDRHDSASPEHATAHVDHTAAPGPADSPAPGAPTLGDLPLDSTVDPAAPHTATRPDATTPDAAAELAGATLSPGEVTSDASVVTELSPADREAARIAAIEAEIAERERRKAAGSPFKAADPVADIARRLAELQTAGRSVRPVTTPTAQPAPPNQPAAAAPSVAATSAASTSAAPSVAAATSAVPSAAAAATTSAAYTSTRTTAVPPSPARTTTSAPPSPALAPTTQPATQHVSSAGDEAGAAARAAGAGIVPGRARRPFARAPHLVFFLHDEVIVHAPAALADEVAEAIRESAAAATRLLFGRFPLDVPLDISIVTSYADAD